MGSHPDLSDDDLPTGVNHLPPGSHVWASNLTREVREMRPMVKEIHDDLKAGKLLLKLMPIAVGIAVGVVEVASWALKNVHLHQ